LPPFATKNVLLSFQCAIFLAFVTQLQPNPTLPD